MEKKEFLIRLGFDLKEFDEKKLTPELVEEVTRGRLGGKGVEIKLIDINSLKDKLEKAITAIEKWNEGLDEEVRLGDVFEELVKLQRQLEP